MILTLLIGLGYSYNVENAFDDCATTKTYHYVSEDPSKYIQNLTFKHEFENNQDFICVEGNVVLFALNPVKADVKYAYYETNNNEKVEKFTDADSTKENVYAIKGDNKYTPIAKLYKGSNSQLVLTNIPASYKVEESNIEVNTIFTTLTSFNVNFKYSKTATSEKSLYLAVCTAESVERKVTRNNKKALAYSYYLDMETEDYQPAGFNIAIKTAAAPSNNDVETTFNFQFKLDSISFTFPWLKAILPEALFAVPYNKGSYTKDEINAFNSTVNILEPGSSFSGNTGSVEEMNCSSYDTIYSKTINKYSLVPEAANHYFTIPKSGHQCLVGNFVFASDGEFYAIIHNNSAITKDVIFNQPFYITDFNGDPAIELKCKSDKCNVQAIPVIPPHDDNEKKNYIRSLFTTRSSIEISSPMKILKDENRGFGLTVYGSKARKVEYSSSKDPQKVLHENSQTKDGKVHEYMPTVKVEGDGDISIDTTITAKISEDKSATEEQISLFKEDIFVELPIYGGVGNKETVDDYTKNSDVVNSNNKLGAGAIVGIVIGVLAFIAIVIFLVWFFVFRNKSGNQDSGSGEKA